MPERFILRGWGCRGGWAGACFPPYPGCVPPAPCAAGEERTAVQSAELGSGRASSWVELSSLAPSFASGQEAELRVDRPPHPCCLAPGPPPPHSACAPQLARLHSDLPQIPPSDPRPAAPAWRPRTLCVPRLPSHRGPSSPVRAGQGRGASRPPHRQPWAVSAGASLVGWDEEPPGETQGETPQPPTESLSRNKRPLSGHHGGPLRSWPRGLVQERPGAWDWGGWGGSRTVTWGPQSPRAHPRGPAVSAEAACAW